MDPYAFKIYMLDVGLLLAMTDLDASVIIDGNRIFTEFKGALTEQYVLQQMIAELGVEPYYYTTANSTGEIDFTLQAPGSVIPVEVKAEENLRAKSLRAFCEKYHPKHAVRTSMSDFREQDWMTNIPKNCTNAQPFIPVFCTCVSCGLFSYPIFILSPMWSYTMHFIK